MARILSRSRERHAVRPVVEELEARRTPSVSFAAQQTLAVGTTPLVVAVGDFNGDGRPDLAVANPVSSTVSVLTNTTTPGASAAAFAAPQTFAVGPVPFGVTVADLDGDGRPDLAVANFGTNPTSNTVSVLLNTAPAGATTFSFAAQQTFAVGSEPFAVAAADYNGDGRPDLAVSNYGSDTVSVLFDTTTPFAGAVPVVAGQFGSQGVWQFNRSSGGWMQLTAANATLLAADPRGDVAGEFLGSGVWVYRPSSGWQHLNGVDATALVMDANGDAVAEFPGYGVGEYLPAAGWRSLTGANASLLAVDALGDVAGEFPGYGVWLFRPASGWKQLNGVDVSLLAMDAAGDVAANFPGYGVGEYRPTGGWRLLNGHEASSLAIGGRGDVVADFRGFGVGEFFPAGGGRSLTGFDASPLAADAAGAVFAEFPGYGVQEYDPYRGWVSLTPSACSLLVVA
jgi:hypothetical protein